MFGVISNSYFHHHSTSLRRNFPLSPPPSALDLTSIGSSPSASFSGRSPALRGIRCINEADVGAASNRFDLDLFVDFGNKVADASGAVIRQYFRKCFDVLDKEDSSPVTIADREAEEAMVKMIQENYPSHAIYGEEKGWRCKEEFADFAWILDPIDGTKSFITGKPVFGTLIALLHKSEPIIGIIDQPILRERWIGVRGRRTVFNGREISTRNCPQLSNAYLYTTSPHLFSGSAEEAFSRVRSKVKVPLYGCDCYAYALLASGHVDLVIESGLKPYDFLALIPVIEGAGGVITDWKGHRLYWEPSSKARSSRRNFGLCVDSSVISYNLREIYYPSCFHFWQLSMWWQLGIRKFMQKLQMHSNGLDLVVGKLFER